MSKVAGYRSQRRSVERRTRAGPGDRIGKTMGLRVSEEEEMKGLDITEHGMEAYPDFQASV